MAPSYISNVQVLRFFAALSVVLAHVGAAIEEQAANGGAAFAMIYPLDWGLGVDVFFLISGFIMYILMHDRFGKPDAPVAFLKRRFLRIAPLYWACTILTLMSILAAGSVVNNKGLDPAHIIASFLFIPWPRANGEVFPLLSLGWTLNYEMLFYFLFAIGLCFSRRLGLTILFAMLAGLAMAAQLLPDSWWMLRFWGNSIIGEFAIGIGLAAVYLRGVRISPPVSIVLVLLGIVMAVGFYQSGSYEYLSRSITGGVPATLIAFGIICAPDGSAYRSCRWLAAGGDASYALYLTHPFVSKIIAVVGAKAHLPPLMTFVGTIAVCVAVSVVVHRVFERPTTMFLNRRLSS
jgi:exopolysaccharide production protein ExoZ